jgi:hypothetical protein
MGYAKIAKLQIKWRLGIAVENFSRDWSFPAPCYDRSMREVFRSTDFTEAGYYKSILDAAGIVSYVRNENTGNPALSGAAFSAALCVTDDADFDQAVRILKEQQCTVPANTPDWACPSCSEKNPANFELCWKCQAPRPAH